MSKEFARKFYSSGAWQACRNEYAARRQFLCENCLRRGIYRPGIIVHHKIEISPVNIERPEITLNPENLELLCRDCHAERHGQGRRASRGRDPRDRFRIGRNGEVYPRT